MIPTRATIATLALVKLGDSITWTHAGQAADIKAFYEPGSGSDFDRRAEPDSPKIIARYSDFGGNLSAGDSFAVAGLVYEAVAPVIIDAPTDEVTIYLRQLPPAAP